ncbi:MAG TPA: hypothetical protein VGL53_22715 [Bryobacteraceae bacterium]
MPLPHALFAPPDEIAPVRPMPSSPLFIGLAFLIPLVAAAFAGWVKGAFGWHAMPPETAGLFAALSLAGLAGLALGFYRQFKPGSRDTIDGRAAAALLLAGLIAFAAVEFPWHPAGAGPLVEGAARCLIFGTVVALATSLVLLAWARLGFAPNPKSAAFWTGALSSAAGVIALGFHCPNQELSHILLGHVPVIIASSFAIVWIARRFFGLR